jgi:hypothetical protein
MAKRVAARWIEAHASPHHRLTAYLVSETKVNIPASLRAFRNGTLRLASVPPIPDLGLQVGFDHVVAWSKDRNAMLALEQWLQARGCETIGVW